MHKKFRNLFFSSVILSILLTACAFGGFGGSRPTSAVERIRGTGTPGAQRTAQAEASATTPPTATRVPKPTKTPVPQINPATEAEKTVTAYFNALQAQDFEAASQLVSNFSLLAGGMIRTTVVDQLNTQMANGVKWEGLQIKDSQVLDARTVLVHVIYKESTIDAKTGVESIAQNDELWPVRLEIGNWLYNWNNLIDFRTLVVTEQATAGVVVKPLQLMRYSDHIALMMLVQNTTGDTVVWGLISEDLATFYFKGKPVVADQSKKFVLNPLRSIPDLTIVVKGLYNTYPEKVEIRKWKNYKVDPWYTFVLNE